jgi:hypothetical protein
MRWTTSLLFALAFLLPRPLWSAPPTWTFGISLQPTSDGQLFSCFLVKTLDGNILETRPLSREIFVKQAQGRATSLANTAAVDLFAQFDIKPCYLPPDSVAMGYSVRDCMVLDDMWKLRYWEYPQEIPGGGQATGKGWSGMPLRPSDRQLALLAAYGLRYTTDVIIGDALFKLLKDMSDPAWVDNYRQG